MKMSEFIEKCKEALEDYGDMEVAIEYGDYYLANDIEVTRDKEFFSWNYGENNKIDIKEAFVIGI